AAPAPAVSPARRAGPRVPAAAATPPTPATGIRAAMPDARPGAPIRRAWRAGDWRTPRNRRAPRCGTWRLQASSQRTQPEGQRLGAFRGLAYFLPRQVHRHAGLACVAAARPERLVAARALGAARIAGVAVRSEEHTSEL